MARRADKGTGRSIGRVLVMVGVAVAFTIVAGAEVCTWRASSRALPVGRLDPGRREPGEVVLVLGYRSAATGRSNAMQRWRTRIAVRSADPETARFVFSGAATRGGRSEAAVMAQYAVELGVPRERIVLEERARSTWENILFSIPLLESAPSITIASNTFHALRARRYLMEQSPELAARLSRADDYRAGENWPVKPLLLGYEWVRAITRARS
ncbi:YdcF family protein [Leifsonia poae]|uniref:YdcF family protein n=1 Tax=Leifsonia poae TaxID=110933 RepID=UPI001CBB01D4|nr:YdcF family protein [Leifsonia poae]